MLINGLFFVKQKTAYEMRISDWSSDVCSSDLQFVGRNLCSPGRQNPSNQSRDTSIPITLNAAIMSLALMLRGPSNGRPSIVRDGEERRGQPASKRGLTTSCVSLYPPPPSEPGRDQRQIGRASCRDRVCPDG